MFGHEQQTENLGWQLFLQSSFIAEFFLTEISLTEAILLAEEQTQFVSSNQVFFYVICIGVFVWP